MKILIPTPITPPTKDTLAMFLDNVLPHLQNMAKTKIIWLVHQPSQIKNPKTDVKDIHDYYDAKNLLETINPSCIIVTPTYEPINYSISLAANFLKIPLISVYLYDYEFTYRHQSTNDHLKYLKSLVRRIFANNVPNESTQKKQFMRRGKFMLYKYEFLIKTKRSLGVNLTEIISSFIKDSIMFVLQIYPEYNTLADLHLLPNNSWSLPLTNFGINEKKLSVTGNPFWDKKYIKIQQRQNTNEHKGKIRVLLLTDALVEHGLWTWDERDSYLTRTLSDLKRTNDITFALKIHPSSENREYYESLLPKLGINVSIYQSEDLWEIINDFDIVLSYGSSYAHTELSSGVIKLIIMDPKNEFVRQPLVKESIECGHVLIHRKFDDVLPAIHGLLNKDIYLTKEFLSAREKLYFKFDGKSGERVASEIIRISTNSNKTTN